MAASAETTEDPGYLVGRGVADVTGEPAGVGMMGYGKADQRTAGLHTRLRSRAFVFVHGDKRLLFVVCDLPMFFESVHRAVLNALAEQYDGLYVEENVILTATHTHCGPGGYSHHLLYNGTTGGFRRKTFEALVSGILDAVERAHADVAPATLTLAHGELHDASANRSKVSFDRNPESDRSFFPRAVDPQTTILGMHRGDRPVGVINWFATHNTSMTNQNRLISSDNKGYAGYLWERVVHGADYLSDDGLDFVSAFAQTNAGDMSPNLNLQPGSGPTDNQFENARIIGTRQYEAAAKLFAEAETQVVGGLDARFTYIRLSAIDVGPEFTGDGKTHRTGRPAPGAAAFAGAWADGVGFPTFREGRNRLWDAVAKHFWYRVSPRLKDSQSPKAVMVSPAGLNEKLAIVAEQIPVQLLRIGQLYLISIPGEVTITAGLRLRRTVAGIVGAELRNVLVAGYSNGYIHYVTTPEEYDAQQYEGGSTLFGRWELPALQQVFAGLATAMRDGTPVPLGTLPPDYSARHARAPKRAKADAPGNGTAFGDLLRPPRASYRPGEQVSVELVGANPNNNLHHGSTYLEVQREAGSKWQTIADDGDWSTKFHWRASRRGVSTIKITWDIPEDVPTGRYRIVYHGDRATASGSVHAFDSATPAFDVVAPFGGRHESHSV